MKKVAVVFTVLVCVLLTALLIVVGRHSIRESQVSKFREMIQSGDTNGVAQAISENPKLIEADMNSDRRERLSPLSLAAALAKEDVCRALIGAGANVDAQDKFGLTPLHKAVNVANANIILMLLQHHAQTSIRNSQGETPVDFARERIPPGLLRDEIVNILTSDAVQMSPRQVRPQ